MRIRVLWITVIALMAAQPALAQLEGQEQKIFRELTRLEGSWFMPTDRGDRLEEWTLENDSTLSGRRFRIRDTDSDTIFLESVGIELRDTSIFFVSVARNQNNNDPVRYQLMRADYEGYRFETSQIENPSKINYVLLGNREIQITTEGRKGARVVTEEYVYEREFAKANMSFLARAGINAHTLVGQGSFLTIGEPQFGWKPGWEVGTAAFFKGNGGYFGVNIDFSVMGKSASVASAFDYVRDTVFIPYRRDATYRSVWMQLAVLPEFFPVREGPLSFLLGPYIARRVALSAKGVVEPSEESDLFRVNEDLNKADMGLVGGVQYRFLKRGSLLGLRANIGLRDLDNLYDRGCTNSAACNGQMFFRGFSLYFAANLLKL
jgi:hypothetical protein